MENSKNKKQLVWIAVIIVAIVIIGICAFSIGKKGATNTLTNTQENSTSYEDNDEPKDIIDEIPEEIFATPTEE
jgi:uncharacterized membrane protein YvbJ